MSEDVVSMLDGSLIDKSEVIAMLGPREDGFSVTTPDGIIRGPSVVAVGSWAYVLGVKPKSMFTSRELKLLSVSFDSLGQVKSAYVTGMDFPVGSTIGPSIHVASPSTPAPKAPIKKGP